MAPEIFIMTKRTFMLICLFPIFAMVSLLSLLFTSKLEGPDGLDCLDVVFLFVSSRLREEILEPVEDLLVEVSGLLAVPISPV